MAIANTNLDPNQVVEKELNTSGRKLKIGIIGTGWIADVHIASYLNMPDVEVVAGADLIPGKAEHFSRSMVLKVQDVTTAMLKCSPMKRISMV